MLNAFFLDSGVGAGIDSYYEYCLKAYILLGDESFLHRFNKVKICHKMKTNYKNVICFFFVALFCCNEIR